MPFVDRRLEIAALLLLCLFSLPVVAQVSAALSGRVTDQSGAAVPGATVTAKDTDMGISRATITDAAGRYELPALPVGRYEVEAEKSGFAEAVRSGIVLVVGQDAAADLSLKVGNVSEQVKVVADAPVVNTTTQDISGLVGEKEVKQLPAEWTQLRFAAHHQPWSGQFHLGEDGRHRSLEFKHGKQFRGVGKSSAAEFVPAERSRVHGRRGEQYAARRGESKFDWRGGGARVQCAARFLWRGIWQAARERRS